MNITSQYYFGTLEEKLVNAGIPPEIAKRYVTYYENDLGTELSFENDELPSDDNFKTLSEMYKAFRKQYKGQSIDEMLIKKFLMIPYSQVESTRKRISELFENRFNEIEKIYESNVHIYDLQPYEATYIYDLLAKYISDEEKLFRVFKRAAIAGKLYTDNLIEAVVNAVGKELAPEVIYESAVNGYLFYPYYTAPVEALKYLKKQFDEQTIAKIIIENPDYLYLYKDEFYVELPEQKERR